MPKPNKHQRREGTPCENLKRKLPGKSHSSNKKKKRKNSSKVVFWGFECPLSTKIRKRLSTGGGGKVPAEANTLSKEDARVY